MGNHVSDSTERPALLEELRGVPTLRHFTYESLVTLARLGEAVHLWPDQSLYVAGDDGGDFSLVLAGHLEVGRETPVGRQALSRLGPGDILGEVSFIDGLARTGTVVAREPLRLARFPASAVRVRVTADPQFAVALHRSFWQSLAGKVRQANERMIEIMDAPMPLPAPQVERHGERIELDAGSKVGVLTDGGLTARELATLALTLRAERFAAESFIFVEGDPAGALYIVADGQVRISRRLRGIGEEALAILNRGDVFGELALIDDRPRSADARAHLGPCTLLSINRRRLEEVTQIDRETGLQFLQLLCRILCRRLRAMSNQLVAWRVMACFR
jgi:CRP/FNR family transcriptional regulator, cyclic AMP receptor protein